MGNCARCKKNLLLSKKYDLKNAKGNKIVYCEDCYNNWMRERSKRYQQSKQQEVLAKDKERKLKTERALISSLKVI